MQALLTDIELDIQELRCLMDAFSREPNDALRGVLRRNIQQMRARLDALSLQLDAVQSIKPVPPVPQAPFAQPPVQPVPPAQPVQSIPPMQSIPPVEHPQVLVPEEVIKVVEVQVVPPVEEKPIVAPTPILAERIRTAVDLRRSISLNDSFRFSRELFDGDSEGMNRVLQQIGEMSSYAAACSFLTSKVKANEENEAMTDLLELLKKYFN